MCSTHKIEKKIEAEETFDLIQAENVSMITS